MNLLWGLIAGVLAYFVSQLVFNGAISALIGFVVFFAKHSATIATRAAS